MSNLVIRKVAVLGAGVMGAQMQRTTVNAKVPVMLFDWRPKKATPMSIVNKALAGLKKLSPAPFGNSAHGAFVQAANYETDLAKLSECDLVIRRLLSRMDWKHALYAKVAPHLAPHAIFASNTSGLSITGCRMVFQMS